MSNTNMLFERLVPTLDIQGPDDCWEWTGGRTTDGYGEFQLQCKLHYAHRVAWQLSNGPIPDKMYVLHSCDNPACCNPSHLSLGTDLDNIQDMVSKRRHAFGERNGHAKLTSEKVREIRRRYAKGGISTCSLANEYGVSDGTVYDAVKHRTWKHLS